jgi:hypothetical protein
MNTCRFEEEAPHMRLVACHGVHVSAHRDSITMTQGAKVSS